MPIEPVKIPQNVYVEDRIVGPVTLRQLIILLLSGGFSYAIWTAAKNQMGAASVPITILCWIPFLIGIVFSFVRIQGIGLMRFILLMMEKLQKPALRQWSPRRGITINFQFVRPENEKKQTVVQPHREKLEELSAMLDRGPLVTKQENEGVAGPTPSESADAPRPVDKDRIQADASEDAIPLHDISSPQQPSEPVQTSSNDQTTLRDILPPSSQHA